MEYLKISALTTYHLWRLCAIHTPVLWSIIQIHENTLKAKLALWLSRAGAVPLSIYIHYRRSHFQHYRDLSRIFEEHTKRIDILQIRCYYELEPVRGLAPLRLDLTRLQELDVILYDKVPEEIYFLSSLGVSTLPDLHCLRLFNQNEKEGFLSLEGINPTNLRTLHLGI